MIQFKPITVEDKDIITSFILPSERRDSNLSIGNLCSWQFLTLSSYALVDDLLVLRQQIGDRIVYSVPVEGERLPQVLRQLEKLAEKNGEAFYIYGVMPELKEMLEHFSPGGFEYLLSEEHFDYVYRRRDLAELKGKDYQPKRNHVNKFRKSYNYEYTQLTDSIVPHCQEMYNLWCEEHNCDEDESLDYEREAVNFALKHFRALDLQGGAIWVEGEIVAFTYGSAINHDTFDVLVEKADTNYNGAYNIINQEFALHLPERFVYLNREEDLGLEGLRKAKQSYRPEFLVEKTLAKKIR